MDTIPREDPQKQPRSYTKAYRAQKAREWRAAHKEKVSQSNRAYADAHKEEFIQYRKARHAANREQLNQQCRESYQEHREARLQSARTYYHTHQEQIKTYRETHRDRRRIVNLARRYGMSAEQWSALYQQQNGCCAICDIPLNSVKYTVDHCHETGNIRGLLCGKCNSGIGMLNDSPDQVLRAYQYLSLQVQVLK